MIQLLTIHYEILFGYDKIQHFIGFAILAFCFGCMMVLISPSTKMRYLWLTLVMIGTLEEYRQYTLHMRSAEFLDAVANLLGASAGILFPTFISILLNKKSHRKRRLQIFKLGLLITSDLSLV